MVSRSSICSTPHPREFLEKLKSACTGGQDGIDHDACAPQSGRSSPQDPLKKDKCPEDSDSPEGR